MQGRPPRTSGLVVIRSMDSIVTMRAIITRTRRFAIHAQVCAANACPAEASRTMTEPAFESVEDPRTPKDEDGEWDREGLAALQARAAWRPVYPVRPGPGAGNRPASTSRRSSGSRFGQGDERAAAGASGEAHAVTMHFRP